MSNRSKSLFRGPNVKHFALVHRSVRDPKLNDPEAGERVLSEVQRGKGKVGRIVVMGTQSTKVDAFWQGRTKDDLEGLLGAENLAEIRANEGEAALYGVYYDDTDYDYMQHMRMVGEKAGPDGEEYGSTLVEAPRKNDAKGKGKERTAASHPVSFRDATVDPDEQEEQTYREYLESSAQEEGLRPDMDPALREILEALEDEAYVEDDTASDLGSSRDGGNFLDALLGGSGKGDLRDRPLEDLFDEDELEEAEHGNDLDPSSTYATQVAKFKRRGGDSDDDFESEDDEFASEAGDTIAELRASSARRPPRKAKADTRSLASGSAFSMSSSSMFRNDGLTTLDDRFDQIEAMYEDDSDEEEDIPEDLEDLSTEQHTQLNNLMDEFLMKYEVLGVKMKPVLGAPDASGAEKLEQLREQFDKMYVLESAKRQEAEERARRKTGVDIDKEDMWVEDREEGKKWDVETVLSTYSNLENHPRMLRLQGSLDGSKKKRRGLQSITSQASSIPPARISLDPKTGFPVVLSAESPANDQGAAEDGDSDATVDADAINGYAKRQTIARAKDETPEQKKARKAEVKADRQARRVEKKGTKETFGQERKRQIKTQQNRLREAADVAKGNQRGIEVMKLS